MLLPTIFVQNCLLSNVRVYQYSNSLSPSICGPISHYESVIFCFMIRRIIHVLFCDQKNHSYSILWLKEPFIFYFITKRIIHILCYDWKNHLYSILWPEESFMFYFMTERFIHILFYDRKNHSLTTSSNLKLYGPQLLLHHHDQRSSDTVRQRMAARTKRSYLEGEQTVLWWKGRNHRGGPILLQIWLVEKCNFGCVLELLVSLTWQGCFEKKSDFISNTWIWCYISVLGFSIYR